MRNKPNEIGIVSFYDKAFDYIINSGYADEIDWQRGRDINSATESEFLREGAWVILCSGFKEQYIRSSFDSLSLCFWDWESSSLIVENQEFCKSTALKIFKNERKIDAIIAMAKKVDSEGFESVHQSTKDDPIDYLKQYLMIGDITCWHLAKNLGCDVAKPDRHMIRISQKFGFDNVHVMCETVADAVNETVAVVDLVLWRYAALTAPHCFSSK